jgi:hypothetical protein
MRPRKSSPFPPLLVNRVTLLLLLAAVVWLSGHVFYLVAKERETAARAEDARQEHEEALARKERLLADLAYVDTERGKEAHLRERYGVAKEGEAVIMLVDGDDAPPPEEDPWWERLFPFLKRN